jgi:hypothetical protein
MVRSCSKQLGTEGAWVTTLAMTNITQQRITGCWVLQRGYCVRRYASSSVGAGMITRGVAGVVCSAVNTFALKQRYQ